MSDITNEEAIAKLIVGTALGLIGSLLAAWLLNLWLPHLWPAAPHISWWHVWLAQFTAGLLGLRRGI